MSNLRDIKQRRSSVVKTKKITQAMKMVAAAKFKRAQEDMRRSREVFEQVQEILAQLISRIIEGKDHPLMRANESKKIAVILFTGDRGLCGGFNSGIIKEAETFLKQQGKSNADLYLVGTKGIQYFKKRAYEIKEVRAHFAKILNHHEITSFLSRVIGAYQTGEYGKVYLVYNEFLTAMTSKQRVEQFLPVYTKLEEEHKQEKGDFIYEPNQAQVMDNLLKEYLNLFFRKSFLENYAAEEGARMTAMESATTNAGEVIKDLELAYNRGRQAMITTEIIEIVAGSISLS